MCRPTTVIIDVVTTLYHLGYNDNLSMKDSERMRRCSLTSVVLSTMEESTHYQNKWQRSGHQESKVLLEKLYYNMLTKKRA